MSTKTLGFTATFKTALGKNLSRASSLLTIASAFQVQAMMAYPEFDSDTPNLRLRTSFETNDDLIMVNVNELTPTLFNSEGKEFPLNVQNPMRVKEETIADECDLCWDVADIPTLPPDKYVVAVRHVENGENLVTFSDNDFIVE